MPPEFAAHRIGNECISQRKSNKGSSRQLISKLIQECRRVGVPVTGSGISRFTPGAASSLVALYLAPHDGEKIFGGGRGLEHVTEQAVGIIEPPSGGSSFCIGGICYTI